MRKLFIFAVYCFAMYSCVVNLEDGNKSIRQNYADMNAVLQNRLSSNLLQNDDAQTKKEDITEKTTEEKNEQSSEDVSIEQMLGEPVAEKQDEFSAESEMPVDENALLDTKIIPEMTLEKLNKMIAKGADVNAKMQNGTTVLMIYSALSSAEMVKNLIDNGADINAANSKGGTALIAACQKNTKEVITLLLQRGASSYAQTTGGKTALDFLSANDKLSLEDKKDIYDTISMQLQ